MKTKLVLAALISTLSIDASSAVYLKIEAPSISIFVNQMAYAQAEYLVKITNETEVPQAYTYRASFCPAETKCDNKNRDGIIVAPHDTFTEDFWMQKPIRYQYSGMKQNNFTLDVIGAESGVQKQISYISVYS